MTNEQIIEMIATHGKKDFYEQSTGNLYRLSEMKYHLFYNQTKIPVINHRKQEEFIITLEGNYETLAQRSN